MNLAVLLTSGDKGARRPAGTNKRMSVTSDEDVVVTVQQAEWKLDQPSSPDAHAGPQYHSGRRASVQEWIGEQLSHISVKGVSCVHSPDPARFSLPPQCVLELAATGTTLRLSVTYDTIAVRTKDSAAAVLRLRRLTTCCHPVDTCRCEHVNFSA